jgi:hypothetical protein
MIARGDNEQTGALLYQSLVVHCFASLCFFFPTLLSSEPFQADGDIDGTLLKLIVSSAKDNFCIMKAIF